MCITHGDAIEIGLWMEEDYTSMIDGLEKKCNGGLQQVFTLTTQRMNTRNTWILCDMHIHNSSLMHQYICRKVYLQPLRLYDIYQI